MSAAPRSAWGRGGVQPSAPNAEPQSVPPPDDSISPYSLKDGDTLWFLDDIVTHPTHYVKGQGTEPCRPDEKGTCPHCASGVKRDLSAWAPALFKITKGDSPRQVWEPRTMRVPKNHIDSFGANIRGRRYEVIAKNKGVGNKLKYEFKVLRRKEPPINSFDVAQVMENIWTARKSVNIDIPRRVFVVDDTVVSPQEKTVSEQIAEMDSVTLLAYHKLMKDRLPAVAEKALAELSRRGEAPSADVLQFPTKQTLDEANAVIEQLSQEVGQAKGGHPNSLQAPVSNPHIYGSKDVGGNMVVGAYPKPKDEKRKAGAA